MQSKLIIIDHQAGEKYEFDSTNLDHDISVGRSEDNSIPVKSNPVSRRHGVVFTDGIEWFYKDIGSSNGSKINSRAIKSNIPMVLRHGDLLEIAEYPLLVNINLTEQEKNPPNSIYSFIDGNIDNLHVFLIGSEEFTFSGDLSQPDIEELGGRPLVFNIVESLSVDGENELIISVPETYWGRVLLNDNAVLESLALKDRDIIEFGDFSFLISKLSEPEFNPIPIEEVLDPKLGSRKPTVKFVAKFGEDQNEIDQTVSYRPSILQKGSFVPGASFSRLNSRTIEEKSFFESDLFKIIMGVCTLLIIAYSIYFFVSE